MNELKSEKELVEMGYQKESDRTYFKSKNDRFFRCGKCGSFSRTTSKLDSLKRLITKCEWCDGNFVMSIFKPLIKVKGKMMSKSIEVK